MLYVRINDCGRANLIQWLEEVHCSPSWAPDVANYLIGQFDGSDPQNRCLSVEVLRTKTISGNPETYVFNGEELDILKIHD